MQKERRTKRKSELSSPPSPSLKLPAQKRRIVIHDSDEEEEEEECPLKRRSKAGSRPPPPLVPALTDVSDQVLRLESNEPAAADSTPQSPLQDAAVLVNPTPATTVADDLPISPFSSPTVEVPETDRSCHQHDIPSSSPASIPDEELEAYFNAPITQPPSTSSPVQGHLEIIEEELQKPFPLDSMVSSKLERSLLKVSESQGAEVPASLRQVCADIALTLSDTVSDYYRFKSRRDDSLSALEELASLKAQKTDFLTRYQSVKSSRDQHQLRQTQLVSRIGSIHEEIARLQAELGVLEPELSAVNGQIKAEDAQRLQLYSQAKALDHKIVPLAEKQKPLEHAVEVGNKGLAEVEASWASLFHKFQASRLPPPAGTSLSRLHDIYIFPKINSL